MPGWLWKMQRRIDYHDPCGFHLDPRDFHFGPRDFHFNPTGYSKLDTESDNGC
jgi:hypothetical protein